MLKFEIGKTYSTRSICDTNVKFTYTVTSRTDKTVMLDNGKKYRPYTYEGKECIKPEGNYSMCPVIHAN